MHSRDRANPRQHSLERVTSEDQHGLRPYEGKLLAKVGQTGFSLARHRVAVLWRPALEHIGDEHLFPAEADLLQEGVQQLACGPYERLALHVLGEPWSLADDHDLGVYRSCARDGLGPCCVQAAPRAGTDLRVQAIELCRLARGCRRRIHNRRSPLRPAGEESIKADPDDLFRIVGGSSAPMHPISRPCFCGPRSPIDEWARSGPWRRPTICGTWPPNLSPPIGINHLGPPCGLLSSGRAAEARSPEPAPPAVHGSIPPHGGLPAGRTTPAPRSGFVPLQP